MSQLGYAQCGETSIHEAHVWEQPTTWGTVSWHCIGLDGSEAKA